MVFAGKLQLKNIQIPVCSALLFIKSLNAQCYVRYVLMGGQIWTFQSAK
jgi:hypothetical protein